MKETLKKYNNVNHNLKHAINTLTDDNYKQKLVKMFNEYNYKV